MKSFGTARLGSNMELRYLQDGTPVGQVSLAFRLGVKDKATGEYKTQWVSASLFGKRAETLAPMLTKGSLHAFVLSDLHNDDYTAKDGSVKTSLKARIDDVELCGGKSESSEQQKPKPAAKSTFVAEMENDIPW